MSDYHFLVFIYNYLRKIFIKPLDNNRTFFNPTLPFQSICRFHLLRKFLILTFQVIKTQIYPKLMSFEYPSVADMAEKGAFIGSCPIVWRDTKLTEKYPRREIN